MQKHLLQLILLIVITTTLFAKVSRFTFTDLDDFAHIVENPFIQNVTLRSFSRFFEKEFHSLYVPITYSYWAILGYFSKGPALYHVCNLILHLMNVLLVYWLVLKFVKNSWAAFWGALVFALHPIQVETVTWISSTKDTLSTLLILSAVHSYFRHTDFGPIKRGHYILATFCFVVALLSKPTAVVTPVLVFMIAVGLYKHPLRFTLVRLSFWIVLALPLVWYTKTLQPDLRIGFDSPLWTRPFVALDSLTFYGSKLLFPLHFTPDYGRTPVWLMQSQQYLMTLFPPIILGFLIYRLKERHYWFTLYGLWIILLFPTLGLIPFAFQLFSTPADRYAYLPMIAIALMVGKWMADHNRITPVAILLAGLLFVRSHYQCLNWENNKKLYTHMLELNPRSFLAFTNLANLYLHEGEIGKAISNYEQALAIRKDRKIYWNLLMAHLQRNEIEKALKYFLHVKTLAPGESVHQGLVKLLMRKNLFHQAQQVLNHRNQTS